MSHFDERSGTVPCKTPWGTWTQTVEEVFIEVDVPEGTKGKDIVCNIHPNNISLSVSGKEIFKVLFIMYVCILYHVMVM